MSKKSVDFFFVGYPKCGSTTFYNLLKAHPEIYAPELKEPKYFSLDIYREMKERLGDNYYQIIESEDEYLSLFEGAGDRIVGDFNPFNIFSKEAPQNIYNHNPDAKILISIREPVSFLRSFHFQSLFRMVEDEPDFMRALALEESRKNGQNIPKLCQIPSYLHYSQLIDYKTHIKRYADLFGIQNVKIVLFEDIVENEYRVYQDILRFLGVRDVDFTPPPPDRNPSHALRFSWLRKILFNPPVRKWLYAHVPLWLLPVGANISQKIFKKQQDKPSVSSKDIELLQGQYKANVNELSIFLNENKLLEQEVITVWGY
jgi:hypothetical protein